VTRPRRSWEAAVVLAAVAAVAACSTPTVGGPPTATTTAGATSHYQAIAEPDDAMAAVYRLLRSPRSTLDLYMYDLVDHQAETIEHNREFGVIIDTPDTVASVAAPVTHDFAGATPWTQR
jgi:hypothetical protein